MNAIYEYICNSEECLFTLTDFLDEIRLKKLFEPDIRTIKAHLEKKYGQNIVISSRQKKETLICLLVNVHTPFETAFKNPMTEIETRDFYLKKAIEIVRSEVANVKSDMNTYPAHNEILKNLNDHVPKSLIDFVEGIVLFKKSGTLNSYKLKCTSIAHAIVSAARPRQFLSPLQTTLAVSLHRKYGSARLINICHSLGFCETYIEAQRFESSAAEFKKKNPIDVVPDSGAFPQFVFDNADVNPADLYGKNGFHNLGGLEIITPGHLVACQQSISRLKDVPKNRDIVRMAEVKIVNYNRSYGEGLKEVKVEISEQLLVNSR